MGVITHAKLNTSGTLTAREKDFAFRFEEQLKLLRTILGISRVIKKESGTTLAYYTAERIGNLVGPATEGNATTSTEYQVKKAGTAELALERYEKAVTAEAVDKYGAEIAIEKTDDAFMKDLQLNVMDRFYNFMKLGTMVGKQKTWQKAFAMSQGAVINQAAATNTTATGLVGFAGILDLYAYLGEKEITIQTAFGLQYVKDFMGCDVVILVPSTILSGKIVCTPVENIVCYAVDPSNSDFQKLGLAYTTTGEGNLIGVHMEGDYKYGTGSTFALLGMTFWAERIDLISVIEIDPNAATETVGIVATSDMATGVSNTGVSTGKRK